MQKTDIWMPLYIGDYLADTSRLTTEQHGAYLLLLMDYWRSGRLPNNDQVLAQITKLPLETWLIHKGVLQGFFEIVDGELIHSRVEKELDDSKDRKLSQLKKSILGNYKKYGSVDERVKTNPKLKDWWDNLFLKISPKESLKDPSSPSSSPSSNKKHIYIPLDVDANDFKEWMAIRKKHKKDWSERVEKRIRKEGDKLGWNLQKVTEYCIDKQWANFEAEWVNKSVTSKPNDTKSGFAQIIYGLGDDNVKQIA